MGNVRRWYVYLVSAVTIQSVTWATINLIRNLIIPGVDSPTTAIAFQISVIVITLPLFLVHWIWAQRQAASDLDERASLPRLLYLYVMMAAFLGPLINNAYQFIRALLHLAFDVAPTGTSWSPAMAPERSVWFNLVPIIVLGLLWFYNQRIRSEDEKAVPGTEVASVVRQLYVYLFTGIGLLLCTIGSISLLGWLLVELFPAGAPRIDIGRLFLADEIARLVVGLSLWLPFWRYAQGLFYGPVEQERESLVRKAFLYLAIFATVITVVTTATIVLSDLLKRLMDVPAGGGDIREAISIITVSGIIWAYHAFVLRGDAAAAAGKEQQASTRRIYLYITAGIGLAAVLAGLVGDLNATIRALSSSSGFILDLREQLAYFTAVLIAGLPLWLVNWSRVQRAAHQTGTNGQAERRALVRRIYLYLYLFIATMAILGSAVYILSQIVELALGARTSTFLFRDVGQALAYMVIAAGVWLYHSSILRSESRLAKTEEAASLRPLRVAVIDTGDGTLGHSIMERIHQQLPSIQLYPLGLSPAAAAAMDGETQQESPDKILTEAEVIVGPWNMAVAGSAGGLVTESIAHSVAESPARKVIIPVRDQDWEWTGVERWKSETIVKEATAAVKQMAIGQEVKAQRRLSAVAIVLIVLGVLFLLNAVPALIALLLL
jgi:hypothetical protein